MEAKVIWLIALALLYWAYEIGADPLARRLTKAAGGNAVVGRRLLLWVFIAAATATALSGGIFMVHPGLVYRDGFLYAYASFYAVSLPFAGMILLHRQWVVMRVFGFGKPDHVYSDCYQDDGIGILSVFIALIFAIPFVGVQLGASGFLFNVLSGDVIPPALLTWSLVVGVAGAALIFIASGRLRTVANRRTAPMALMAAGVVALGIFAANAIDDRGMNVRTFGRSESSPAEPSWVNRWTGREYNSSFVVPPAIQFSRSPQPVPEPPSGGPWAAAVVGLYLAALIAIRSAPPRPRQ